MINKQKLLLSLSALVLSLAMVVFSVSSAQAMSDEVREGLNQLGNLKKEQIKERVEAGKATADEVKAQQKEETKEYVGGKVQERANQAREDFSEKHGWGNGEIRDEVHNKGDEVAIKVCQRSKERYQKRLDFYKQIENKYVVRYEDIVDRIASALDKLEALGLDVSEARTKFDTWRSKIDEVVASLRTNMSVLEELTSVDCNDPQAAREQVKAVRARLEQTGMKAKEVRQYYQDEVRPALMDMKNQKAE